MRKIVGVVLLMVVLSVMVAGVAVADTAQPAAQAQAGTGEYMDVSGIVPFSGAANFMSLTGYLRWTVLRDQHVMRPHADEIQRGTCDSLAPGY